MTAGLWAPPRKSNSDDWKSGRIIVTDGAGLLLRELDPDISDRYDRPCPRHTRRQCNTCLLGRSYGSHPAKPRPMSKIEG